MRDYNITKKEGILEGASILYGSASELKATLEYDLMLEKNFSYKNLSMSEIIHHLSIFVSRLWQIHMFGEGNTRTTAVFFIKYLRILGFDAKNDIFAKNAWYFRNALVRANYNDIKRGIHETTEYLELFLRNLLLNEKNELRNRELHISKVFSQKEKVDIQELLLAGSNTISQKTINHTIDLYSIYGSKQHFGRSDVEKNNWVKIFWSF
ncbi:MAG TPA: Fic family protein [Fusobacterium sp.]|uniref:Fic family protein n=1 Tax=Fusobacterium sp. TaxID=68766 RepID=UPI002F40E4DF